MEDFIVLMKVTGRLYLTVYAMIGISCLLSFAADKQEKKGAR